MFRKNLGLISLILLIICTALIILPGAIKIDSIPENLYINENESKCIDLELPLKIKISGDDTQVLKFNGTTLAEEDKFTLSKPINIESKNNDKKSIDLEFSAFGILPIKSVSVSVDARRVLIPGGESIGVALYTKGALVVGTAEILMDSGKLENPAKEAGILPGDVIIAVDGEKIKSAQDLSDKINNYETKAVCLTILRNDNEQEFDVYPALDTTDNKYKLGVWVRDSTAGVGTLTFIDPNSLFYGGLGHAITDIDTGKILSIEKGEIIKSQILEIARAEDGIPGELKGYFTGQDERLGNILYNTRFGIFGELYDTRDLDEYNEPVLAGHKEDVSLGKAYILSTIDDNGVKKFDCEVIGINEQAGIATKSFIIKIIDEDLIEKTGGIVQGMSGSPIIQNGKLIGAVTHVFVNDPTKGYGVFLDMMLGQIKY